MSKSKKTPTHEQRLRRRLKRKQKMQPAMSEQEQLFQALAAMSGGAAGMEQARQLEADIAAIAAKTRQSAEHVAHLVRKSLAGQMPDRPVQVQQRPEPTPRAPYAHVQPTPVALRQDTPVSTRTSQQTSTRTTIKRIRPELHVGPAIPTGAANEPDNSAAAASDAENRERAGNAPRKLSDS